MCGQHNYVGALPLLQKLAEANPGDVFVPTRDGFVLAASTVALTDPEARRQARLEARSVLLHACDLGDRSNLVAIVPADRLAWSRKRRRCRR